jgi:hypothetical protein
VPAPVVVRALVDTGAESTCADPSVLAPLNLPLDTVTFANVPAAGGLVTLPQYDAGITVVHPSGKARFNLVVGDLKVVELSLGWLGYDALLGRDVLNRCALVYHGPRQRFKLAY